LVGVRVLGVHVADDEDGFDPDAEFIGLVCVGRGWCVREMMEAGMIYFFYLQ
jgi:hypothetical protein